MFLWYVVEMLFMLSSVSVVRVMTELELVRSWSLMMVAHAARLYSHNIAAVIASDTSETMLCL